MKIVPVPQIAERIVEVVTAFHNVQIVIVPGHTHSGGEGRQRFSISRSKLRTHRMQRLWHDPAVNL